MRRYLIFILIIAIGSCTDSVDQKSTQKTDPVSDLMSDIRSAHGELGNYQFVFRENTYSFHFDGEQFEYEKRVENDSLSRRDVLSNDGFIREENGQKLVLSQEEIDKYSESLNSVIYFVCLPLKLDDPAVNKELLPVITIMGKPYDVLKVTFDQEGGGKDFEDVFYYWINQSTHQMDFLAYQYAVNGGGVRFRSAFNSRMIDGMRFQDYINYGASVGTPLDSLPSLYERGMLDELSEIISENVISL